MMRRNLRALIFQTTFFRIFLVLALSAACVARARGDAALLLEEPFGDFGAMNPTGHAAIYLSRVCAASPTELRRCRPGEEGVVISRYHRVGGFDWVAIPLIPYLYAVDHIDEIPSTATPRLEHHLRDAYRRKYLLDIVPDDPVHEIPSGEWIQLVGSAYDRRIWGFNVATTPAQDDRLIDAFNDRSNVAHFNLFFRNCANFSESILNFYYPNSVHRNFVADVGIMTPKQIARSLVKYDHKHEQMDLRTFVIPQIPGTIHRSHPVDGVIESLVKSKKYVIPLVWLNPEVTGSLLVAWISDGRFHPDPHAAVYNPALGLEPGQQPAPSLAPAEKRAPAEASVVPVSDLTPPAPRELEPSRQGIAARE
jgi:hypothetical protein